MPQEFLTYKGKPLVRSGDTLYYGSMGDKCVAHLQIKSQREQNGLQQANKVAVQLISTDETLPLKERMLNLRLQTSGWNATIRKTIDFIKSKAEPHAKGPAFCFLFLFFRKSPVRKIPPFCEIVGIFALSVPPHSVFCPGKRRCINLFSAFGTPGQILFYRQAVHG